MRLKNKPVDTHSQCSCRKTCDCISPSEATGASVGGGENEAVEAAASMALNEAIRVNHQLTEAIDWSAQLQSKDMEIERLKTELRQATASLEAALEDVSKSRRTVRPVIDLGTESPLNLFIQCFKEKYDVCVNPNDVAIFV